MIDLKPAEKFSQRASIVFGCSVLRFVFSRYIEVGEELWVVI